MPTYDYRCKACGHEFELFQSMTEKPKRACPACRKNALERLIGTGAALLFKGSGFYQTDYRSESYRKAADAEKPAPAESKAGEAKPESKPEKSVQAEKPGTSDANASEKPKASKAAAKPAKQPARKR